MKFYKITTNNYDCKCDHITKRIIIKNIYFLMNKYGSSIFDFNITYKDRYWCSFMELIKCWIYELINPNLKKFHLKIITIILSNKLNLKIKTGIFWFFCGIIHCDIPYLKNIINLLNTKNIKYYIYRKGFYCLNKKYYKIRKIIKIIRSLFKGLYIPIDYII